MRKNPFRPDPRCFTVDGFQPNRWELKAMPLEQAAPFMGVGASKRCATQEAATWLGNELFKLGRWAKIRPMKSGGFKVIVTPFVVVKAEVPAKGLDPSLGVPPEAVYRLRPARALKRPAGAS